MLGHWRFLRDLFPGYLACLNRLEFHEDQDNHWSGLLTAGKFSQQAQRIRAWAPSMIQGVADEDEQAGLRLELADSLSWLETLEAQTSWQSRVQRHKYSSRTLIQAVFFRFTLGSASKIGKAFQLALSVGIPGLDLRTFASQASLPSKTALSRGSVYLDMSSLLVWQKKWQQDEYVMFMWADSSGRDWLMSMAAMRRVRKLSEAAQAVKYLVRTRPDWSDHWEALDPDLEVSASMTEQLQTNLRNHTFLPVALGSGRSKVEVFKPRRAQGPIGQDLFLDNRHGHGNALAPV